MSAAGKDTDTIWMHSHVSGRDGHPYVVMNWGPLSTQWTVEEAVAHAQALVECAHAAAADALIFRILKEDKQAASAFLSLMRELRGSTPNSSEKRSTGVRQEEGE